MEIQDARSLPSVAQEDLRRKVIRAIRNGKKQVEVAEDTRLFLDSVSDCERFEASWAGIKAAAEVLRRHGIQAEPRGETDKEVAPCQG